MSDQIDKNYQDRLNRLNDAIALKEPDRVPICAYLGIIPYVLDGCTYRDAMYNYPRAKEAIINYFKKYPMADAALCPKFSSGKANELAGTTMLDWPDAPVPRFLIFPHIRCRNSNTCGKMNMTKY